MQMKKDDILGHECIGVVEKVGPTVTKVKPGDRVVSSFNIACGKCDYCKKKLFTSCEAANNSSVMDELYGHRIAGVMGYSHVSICLYLTYCIKYSSIFLVPWWFLWCSSRIWPYLVWQY